MSFASLTKTFFGSLLFIGFVFGASSAHAESLVCNGNGEQIELDLSIPKVTELTDGARHDLISDTSLSSWDIDPSTCQIQDGWSADHATYRYEFHCFGYRRGGAHNETDGTFEYDAASGSGTYEEQLAAPVPSTYIEFSGCRSNQG